MSSIGQLLISQGLRKLPLFAKHWNETHTLYFILLIPIIEQTVGTHGGPCPQNTTHLEAVTILYDVKNNKKNARNMT